MDQVDNTDYTSPEAKATDMAQALDRVNRYWRELIEADPDLKERKEALSGLLSKLLYNSEVPLGFGKIVEYTENSGAVYPWVIKNFDSDGGLVTLTRHDPESEDDKFPICLVHYEDLNEYLGRKK